MALKSYGVLKGRAIASRLERDDKQSPHYQVHIKTDRENYRIAINVKSVQKPVDLLYLVDDNFNHPITTRLIDELADSFGFKNLPSQPGGLALDYIRGNLFDVNQMKPLPADKPGVENDLNDLIDLYIKRAINSNDAVVYAFGEPWGPENKPDKIFDFSPGRGVHNIHMNQGSSGNFAGDNGVWQDGGLLIHFPSRNQWVGGFFAFQSQSFHAEDRTGEPLTLDPNKTPLDPRKPGVKPQVRIVAALVNPVGEDPAKETLTLMNASSEIVNLRQWAIADRLKRKHSLNDISLAPGAVATVPLTGEDAQFGNDGGIISLLDPQGVKIDGVSYTKADAQKPGWTIVF